MRTCTLRVEFMVAFGLALAAFTGCESTDSGSTHVSGSVYYGVGFYDPWYYGGYYDDVDIVVTPPDRPSGPPDGTAPPRPTHPIAPTPSPTPRPTPMPSIPRTPMPRARVR
jgi:hypothetical protein